jgi:pyruvate-ferredoxin/flavodoxin oxidoreductase
VLDRTKDPGALVEPLYLDVIATFARGVAIGKWPAMPTLIGGRYGLSSKDFDPAMAKAVFDELKKANPKHGFTVGIVDDVSHTSLEVEPSFDIESPESCAHFLWPRCRRHRWREQELGENSAADESRYAQGYFVYDSRSRARQRSRTCAGPRGCVRRI